MATFRFFIIALCSSLICTHPVVALDRTELPIPEPEREEIDILDARDAKAPPPFAVTAPRGAPNIVIVLIDDMGFGHSSAFGGPIQMPTAERLAGAGLRFNRFHTTALCSPTRVALLTGRNHHVNNAGAIMELATAFPGNTGIRPRSVAPVAEMLRQNGYSTAAFGKYHETPPWEVSVSGPYDRWPTHSGFDKFYGFIGGETNQWAPAIYDGVTRVEHPRRPDYHFTTDMTDQAIRWVKAQQSITPERPFFMYYAPGATHAPHHVPEEYTARYRGKFSQGWDILREETFARQKRMGIVPQGARLTARPAEIAAWDSHSETQRQLFARQMEVYAGFGEHTDVEVGRLVSTLEAIGEFDNTLFFYILGDNGASAEGGPEGTYNEIMALNGIPGKAEQMLPHIEAWGDATTFPHFAVGWAHAGNTPFQWTKQVASHFGGTRNGMIVHWPARIEKTNQIRSQFSHVTDIAPTLLEAAGIPFPERVDGVEQRPFDGASLIYSFDSPSAPERHKTQYFEMFGNRAIYHDGWVAATRHSIPWVLTKELPALEEDRWELYNVAEDFSQAEDLANRYPDKLRELKELFEEEAIKNHVYPLDDRRSERFIPAMAGRPDLIGSRSSLTLYEGMSLMENAFLDIKNRSYAITAELEVPAKVNGVIIAQAGRFGGWTLFTKEGRVHYEYNFFGLERTRLVGRTPLAKGKHTVRFEFIADSRQPGTGGKGRLSIDGVEVAHAMIAKTQPFMYSGDEGIDIGVDGETTVSNDYVEGNNRFGGRIEKVVVEQLAER
ncbi:MAG: arylsulfatase [Bdellovibrionota bacterium]|nr:MAG: arylsulfatase [Bdellovibrionota bacterium]